MQTYTCFFDVVQIIALNTHLHSNEAIIDHNILRQKVGTNGGLVLVAEFFVDICIYVLRNNMVASKLNTRTR